MAEHVHKKYIAKVEKTVYTVETLEFIAATEKEAEEMLDDYCASSEYENAPVKVIETEIQEEEVSGQWIDVTDVPDGNYMLTAETNPDQYFEEYSYSNNNAEQGIKIEKKYYYPSITSECIKCDYYQKCNP